MACDKEYHFPLEVSLSVTEFSCLISAFYVYGWKLANCDVRQYAGMYWNDELVLTKTTVKDVCDKIIHADVFKKSVLPNEMTMGAYATIQMQGSRGKREWTLNLCVALFCEKVLSILEEAESIA